MKLIVKLSLYLFGALFFNNAYCDQDENSALVAKFNDLNLLNTLEAAPSNEFALSDYGVAFFHFLEDEVWKMKFTDYSRSKTIKQSAPNYSVILIHRKTLNFLSSIDPDYLKNLFKLLNSERLKFIELKHYEYLKQFDDYIVFQLKMFRLTLNQMNFNELLLYYNFLMKAAFFNNPAGSTEFKQIDLPQIYRLAIGELIKQIVSQAKDLKQIEDFLNISIKMLDSSEMFRISFDFYNNHEDQVSLLDAIDFWEVFFNNSHLRNISFENLLYLTKHPAFPPLDHFNFKRALLRGGEKDYEITRARTFLIWALYENERLDPNWIFPNNTFDYLLTHKLLPSRSQLRDSKFLNSFKFSPLRQKLLEAKLNRAHANSFWKRIAHAGCQKVLTVTLKLFSDVTARTDSSLE